MSEFFTTIGGIITVIGLAWCGLVMSQPGDYTGYGIMAKVFAMTPGLGVAGTGLMFLAIGGVLSRLDRIARNTAAGTVALERIVGATRGASDARRETNVP